MIGEKYVSFETSKLLKEKGFDEYCTLLYDKEGVIKGAEGYYEKNSNLVDEYSVPTQAVVMKWLREIHKIGIFPSIYCHTNGEGTEEMYSYGTAIINLKTYDLIFNDIMYKDTYEEACEIAIEYVLKNLI